MQLGHETLVAQIERLGLPPRVLEAFRAVDRANYVPPGLETEAYLDRPVPLPEGQTTSQPTLIAQMVAAAAVEPDDLVLEVGTGYGYQTAVLAHLAGRVVSIERWPRLAEAARRNLERNSVEGVSVYVGDGYKGRSEDAPYDAVVVSAAASRVPEEIVDQMANGARLVIPIRTEASDDVRLFRKNGGRLEEVGLVSPARFVPLIEGDEVTG